MASLKLYYLVAAFAACASATASATAAYAGVAGRHGVQGALTPADKIRVNVVTVPAASAATPASPIYLEKESRVSRGSSEMGYFSSKTAEQTKAEAEEVKTAEARGCKKKSFISVSSCSGELPIHETRGGKSYCCPKDAEGKRADEEVDMQARQKGETEDAKKDEELTSATNLDCQKKTFVRFPMGCKGERSKQQVFAGSTYCCPNSR